MRRARVERCRRTVCDDAIAELHGLNTQRYGLGEM